jgi:hypothetical protein
MGDRAVIETGAKAPVYIILNFDERPCMAEIRKMDKARRQRMRYAERKLKEAQRRLARAERSIVYWTRVVGDLRHERVRAVQPPLWPEEEVRKETS